MWFDPTTLFVALIVTLDVAGLSLLWSWARDRAETMLAWSGGALLLASVGVALFSGTIRLPPGLHEAIGPAVIIVATSAVWTGARAFNGRPPRWAAMVLGPLAWVLFWASPLFADWVPFRSFYGSALIALFMLLAAREFRAGEPLPGRLPLALLIAAHALVMLLRIPIIVGLLPAGALPFHSPWLGVVLLEAIAFVQMTAILAIGLTKQRLEARLRQAAATDPLTGLCNRRAFFEQGTARLAACARTGRPAAVAIFDLDEFKAVNDTYGHAAGDAVLKAFAHAVTLCIAPAGIAGRIGGEEFAVMLPDCDAGAATEVAHCLMERFTQQAAEASERGIVCTASGGIALSADGRGSVEDLLNAADLALYDAKREGDNVLRIAPQVAALVATAAAAMPAGGTMRPA